MRMYARPVRPGMTDDRKPTSVQIAIRVLVRGLPLPEGVSWRLSGYQILITGRASAANWAPGQVHFGDLEAVLWCDPREAPAIVENLRTSPNVVATQFEGAP